MDGGDIAVNVIVAHRLDRGLRRLAVEGYTAGPAPSNQFSLKEGDLLDLTFRGNVRCTNSDPTLRVVFNSNLENLFHVDLSENDTFVQKGYDVYRGFVVLRTTQIIIVPPPEPSEDDVMTDEQLEAEAKAKEEKRLAEEDEDGDDEEEEEEEVEEEIVVEVEPPKPTIEYKYDVATEILVTFPKVGSMQVSDRFADDRFE